MRILLCVCCLLLAGCSIPTAGGSLAPTPQRDQWLGVWPGAEVLRSSDGLIALRHAPAAARYGHAFNADGAEAAPVSDWLRRDGAAAAAVNCGFFSEVGGAYEHIGLLMTGGNPQAALRAYWGGVLIVREGVAFVAARPQRLLAPAALGVQGWPMLVQGGVPLSRLDNREPARRTAVGVDGAGNVVWVAAVQSLTLHDFAARLLAPDLGLVDAVNLDGGGSTGLRWRLPDGAQAGADSLPIPCALLFYPSVNSQ